MQTRTANQLNKVPVSQASSHTKGDTQIQCEMEITEYTEVISHKQWKNMFSTNQSFKKDVVKYTRAVQDIPLDIWSL